MAILFRAPAPRTSLQPGVWFLVLGAVVAGLSLFASREPAGRVFGLLLAGVLVVRGVARIRQARLAAATEREQLRVGKLGDHAEDAAAR